MCIRDSRLIDFDLEAFKNQIKDAVKKYVKGFITNVPSDNQIPVFWLKDGVGKTENTAAKALPSPSARIPPDSSLSVVSLPAPPIVTPDISPRCV